MTTPPNVSPRPDGRDRPHVGNDCTSQHGTACCDDHRPSDDSSRPITSLCKFVVFPVLVLLVAAFLTGFFAPSQSVLSGTAREFLASYFSKVVQADQRQALYSDDLTPSFHNGSSWNSYNTFWKTQESVTVLSVVPVQQSALEFQVNLIFHPLTGGTTEETYNFWFACKSFFGTLRSRVSALGCPLGDLAIDNQQQA